MPSTLLELAEHFAVERAAGRPPPRPARREAALEILLAEASSYPPHEAPIDLLFEIGAHIERAEADPARNVGDVAALHDLAMWATGMRETH